MNRVLRDMLLRRKRRSPATVIFGAAVRAKHKNCPCVYARCEVSQMRTAPVWGQTEESQRRALANLTRICECPARFHNAVAFEGEPAAVASGVQET